MAKTAKLQGAPAMASREGGGAGAECSAVSRRTRVSGRPLEVAARSFTSADGSLARRCPSALLESGLIAALKNPSPPKAGGAETSATGEGDSRSSASELSAAGVCESKAPFPAEAFEVSDGETPKKAAPAACSSWRLYGVFVLIVLLEILVNFDSGVVPAVLVSLEREFEIDGSLEGLLGALPYIGLVVSSPVVGRGLTVFPPKWFCFFSMVGNVLSTALLGLAKHRWVLFLARFLIGLTQAAFCIYAPVWVDSFSPPQSLTLWMGLTQGGVVIGTIFGCLTAGALDAAHKEGAKHLNWRQALLVQCCGLFLLVLAWGFTPSDSLNVGTPDADARPPDSSTVLSPVLKNDQAFKAEEELPDAVKEPDVAEALDKRPSLAASVVELSRHSELTTPPSAETPGASRKDSISPQRRSSAGMLGRKSSAGPAAPNSARLNTRLSHRASVAHEYLKDPLSNFLPLQFFQTPSRRASRSSIAFHPAAGGGSPRDGPASIPGEASPPAETRMQTRAQRAFTVAGGVGGFSSSQGPAARAGEASGRGGVRSFDSLRKIAPSPVRRRTTAAACAARSSLSGVEAEAAGGGVGRYQVTFFSAAPTTLACEALNWAAGISNPLSLVRTSPSLAQQHAQGGGGAANALSSPSSGQALAKSPHAGGDAFASGSLEHEVDRDVEAAANGCEEDGFAASGEAPAFEEIALSSLTHGGGVAGPAQCGVGQSVKLLLCNPLYVCVTISLCALFFEVTAIQFWSIKYFQQVMKHSHGTVLIAFNATAATAPILGVLSGGWCFDRLGGYKTAAGLRRSLTLLLGLAVFCCLCGAGAALSAALTARAHRPGAPPSNAGFACLVLSVWLLLFAGASALPAAAGVVIAAVPARARAFGSGFCMMVYSIFGYVLGAFLPGVFIQLIGLEAAMRIVYMWSIFGVLGFGGGLFVVRHLNINPMIMANANDGLSSSTQGCTDLSKVASNIVI